MRAAKLARDDAAKDVDLIRACRRDHQVTVADIRLLLHLEARAVSMHHHHVVRLDRLLQHLFVRVNHHDVMAFLAELLGQGITDLAVAHNHDLHIPYLLLPFSPGIFAKL